MKVSPNKRSCQPSTFSTHEHSIYKCPYVRTKPNWFPLELTWMSHEELGNTPIERRKSGWLIGIAKEVCEDERLEWFCRLSHGVFMFPSFEYYCECCST